MDRSASRRPKTISNGPARSGSIRCSESIRRHTFSLAQSGPEWFIDKTRVSIALNDGHGFAALNGRMGRNLVACASFPGWAWDE
jgi:hypothetical protein